MKRPRVGEMGNVKPREGFCKAMIADSHGGVL
jgi:hypothetical protein